MSTIESTSYAAYQDSTLAIEERVSDLLSRMSLEEKVAQMMCIWNERHQTILDAEGFVSEVGLVEHYPNGLGQVGRPGDAQKGAVAGKTPTEMAKLTNEIQQAIIANNRLGIPVMFHDECLHGLMALHATSFPQPIGLGATFNPDLVRRLFELTALEARVCGIHQALGPVVDVARDPRWGRVEETFGEDPYLVGELGVAAVLGLQGEGDLDDGQHVIATLKHFAAHGEPESGNNCAPVNVSERILREVFLYPFQQAIQRAGALSVMASYNEIDGVPSHASRFLLKDILRREWNFDGYVVSDYYAIRELDERPGLFGHHLAADAREAALLAVRAGVNVELPEPDCYKRLPALVADGSLEESVLDELVAPILELKFRLGLFENPYVDPTKPAEIVNCQAHKDLALEAALQTITLLKNQNNTVPLDLTQLRTIAVIGPNANRELLGGYSGRPAEVSTVLSGIRDRVAGQCEVLTHEGCRITEGGSWWEDKVTPADPVAERQRIRDAVAVANQADVIVLALGGNEQTCREAWSSDHLGDRADLQMVGLQDELVNALAETGKPIVALLFNGRPLAVDQLAQKAAALFECWYLGQHTGLAVAEVLFGDVNPSGKLPITIPRSVGHLPAFYNHKPSARRGYLFDEVTPLFPFGFGLTYTTFRFGLPQLQNDTIAVGETTSVTIEVTNQGKYSGTEVVQLYIRDRISSVTRPVKELKGFQRVSLQPGESRLVQLEITPASLAFWDINKEFVVEPGEFDVMVGPNSVDLAKVTLTVE